MALDISQRIRNVYAHLSKGQKKIASAVLTNYDKVAYMTATRLGLLVGVSESTVVRFAIELGYDGYSEFQRAVEELVRSRLTPNQRIEVMKKRIGRSDVLENVMEADIANIRYTLETIDRDGFGKAVESILQARNVYVLGARSASALAFFLHHNLSLIMDNVKLVQPTSAGEVFEQLFGVTREDCVIAFSFPRYSNKIIQAVNFSQQQGADTVVITDSATSPLAEFATCLLTARSDMASFADSLVAPLSIVNALVCGIVNRRQTDIEDRFNKLEKIWNQFDIYAKR